MTSRVRARRAGVAAALLAATLPAGAAAVTPTDGAGFPSFLSVEINLGPGMQYDPHVDGDLVSYTSDNTVHVYSFLTGDDVQVPGISGTEDHLAGVAGGLVVFSRFDPISFESYVHLYDVASGTVGSVVAAGPGLTQTNAAIGGQTVAFVELLSDELTAARLGGSSTQLTNDDRSERFPDVADSGDLIVWESCVRNTGICDVHQATWNGTTWSVISLTSTPDPETGAATDGSTVAYESTRSNETDIYWQPVGGGPEQRIDLPGLQRGPRVAGGLIAFVSATSADNQWDLFVYRMATNELFRVTSTPWHEQLGDLDVLADGRVRLVWATVGLTPDAELQRDVVGATLELPPAGPHYGFGGFQSPVEPRPTLNSMKAGAAVPVKFSLGGDQGLGIFASGYPRSQSIACDSSADVDPIEQTVAAGGSSLTYDPVTDTYAYVWKTDKAWKGSCRQLVLGFADGSFARANFLFK